MSSADSAVFEEHRTRLLGLAYRMLGSRAEAEDAVQDTYLKWRKAGAEVRSPAAWLTTACTRRCLDLLKAAYRTRVDYVGDWLPEPIDRQRGDFAAEEAELASSLSTAFLLLLERLTPKERAAYLLHEIFDLDYPEVAKTLDLKEAACRKLVSRARAHVEQAEVRHTPPAQRQEELLDAFHVAIRSGETAKLTSLLSDDIALHADGGGKASAIRHARHGKAEVLAFVSELLSKWWSSYEWRVVQTNGGLGVAVRQDGKLSAAVTFDYDASGRACRINVMRNPDKLASLGSSLS